MRAALLLLGLAVALALPAGAHGATLFSNLDAGHSNGGLEATSTQWLGQSFVPTTSGTARTASLFAVAYLGQTTNVTVSLYTSSSANGGQPGTLLATGAAPAIDDDTDSAPTCSVLGTSVALSAGQTYWAVLRSSGTTANWLGGAPGGSYRVSTNSGGTWGSAQPGGFSLRVDDTTSCAPDLTSNPVAGGLLEDMYAKPTGTSFQTLFVANDGTQQLNLTGASYSGPHASMFKLYKGEPGGPEGSAFTFPKGIGTGGGGALLYIVCAPPAGTADGTKTATLTLTSNDPDEGSVTWPVRCVVDSTPPTLDFLLTPTGRDGWHITRPAPLAIRGVDPASGNRVKHIFCTDSLGPALDWPNGSVASFALTTDGLHALSCQATDAANNTSAPGAHTTTVKVDATPPETTTATPAGGPPFTFAGDDALSGLAGFECRVDDAPFAACTSPATPGALPGGVHAFEARARDVAGNADPTPLRWSWRVDAPPVVPDGGAGGRGAPRPGTSGSASGRGAGATPVRASGLTLRPATFRPARGTTIRYRLDRAARVVFTVERATSRRRYVRVSGSFAHAGRAGRNTLRFRGRVARRVLRPGRYRLVATPAGAGAVRATFRIRG